MYKKRILRSLILAAVLGIISGCIFYLAFAEQITITTYYPAPYGVYKEMRSKRMAIGDTYYDSSQHCWPDGPCAFPDIADSTNLIVEGNVGIGTADPGSPLEVVGNYTGITPQLLVKRSSSYAGGSKARIYANSGNQAILELEESGGEIWALKNLGNTDNSFSIVKKTGVYTGEHYFVIETNGNVGIGTASPGTARLKISGGTLDMDSNKIINLATPTHNNDAATKKYVDDRRRTALYVGTVAHCNAGVVSTNPAHLNCATTFIGYTYQQ